MNKKLIAIGVALCMASVGAMADTLTLESKNISDPVQVNCNGVPGLPIPANGQLGPLKYAFLSDLFGGQTLACRFKVANNRVGTATLLISSDNTTAKVISYNPGAGYSVTINPSNATGQPVADMTVTLTKN